MSDHDKEWYERPAYSVGLHEWLGNVLELSDEDVAKAHDSMDGELTGDTMGYMMKFAMEGLTTERIYVHLRGQMENEILSAPIWVHVNMCAAIEFTVRNQGLTDRCSPDSVHHERPIGKRRDWKTNPPQTMRDAALLAAEMARSACDHGFAMTGQRPIAIKHGRKIVIVWPDGEVTNEIQISKP